MADFRKDPSYDQLIDSTEQEYNLPKGLLRKIVDVESGGNPNAVSPAGAKGLTQFMPATAAQYGVNVNDPVSSVKGTAKFLTDLNKKYKGDWRATVAHYNGGGYNAQREIDGAEFADPKKVSAKNNAVNIKYVNDTLGPRGTDYTPAKIPASTSSPLVKYNQPKTFNTDDSKMTQEELDAIEAQRAPALPVQLPNPYEGTTQAATNPGNPQAGAISVGDPSVTDAAMDEYRKRYLAMAPYRAIGTGLAGFGGAGASGSEAVARQFDKTDKANYDDTVGRIEKKQTAAQKAEDLARGIVDRSKVAGEFAQTAPGKNNEAAYQSAIGKAGTLESKAIAAILKKQWDLARYDPKLLANMNVDNMSGAAIIKAFGNAIPGLRDAALTPSIVGKANTEASVAAGVAPSTVKTAAELAEQSGQTTKVGQVAVDAAQAPPNANVTRTTSGTTVTTSPSAAATTRETSQATAGANSTNTAIQQYNDQQPKVEQLRNAIITVKPYQNTPGATIYSALNSGQTAALQQMVKDAEAQGIKNIPDPTAPQNVWRNFVEQYDAQILTKREEAKARQAAIDSGKGDGAMVNYQAPVIYINPKTGAKIAVPAEQARDPATRKKLMDAGLMIMNGFLAANTWSKGQ